MTVTKFASSAQKSGADGGAVRKVLDEVRADGRSALTAPEAKIVCDAYAIPLPKEGLATSADQAVRLGASMGFPVVMKIVSADILHKTDAGGVVVGVKSDGEARAALRQILANAQQLQGRRQDRRCPGAADAAVRGDRDAGSAPITDPSFGKLVAFGLGGVLVEVLKDLTFRLAPVSQRRRRPRCWARIKAQEMLNGVRGSEPVDREALAEVPGQRLGRCSATSPRSRSSTSTRCSRPRASRPRSTPASSEFRGAHRALPPGPDYRQGDEPDLPSEGGRRDRRLQRGRQDRQLGDEEPDQRRLQGRDRAGPPEGRHDRGQEGLQVDPRL